MGAARQRRTNQLGDPKWPVLCGCHMGTESCAHLLNAPSHACGRPKEDQLRARKLSSYRFWMNWRGQWHIVREAKWEHRVGLSREEGGAGGERI